MANNTDYIIDLKKIWDVIRKNAVLFTVIILACCAAAFGGSKFLLKKQYRATATVVIVSNNDQDITYNDVQLSQKLVDTYSRILTSETVGDRVISNLGLEMTSSDFKKIINVSSSSNSEVLDVSATTEDPSLSADIANETVSVFSNQVYKIMNIRNVTVLDTAKPPLNPSGPNLKRNVLLGAAIGFLLCALIALWKSLKDTKIKTEDEVKRLLYYPVIGSVPEQEEHTGIVSVEDRDSLASEAYRTLRTNISMRQFDKEIRVINCVSCDAQEGKTTTVLNLAAVYAQLGKRVLVVDLDLRLPSVHKKLGIKNTVGITDVVTRNAKFENVVIRYKNLFDVLLSGTRMPFASEFAQSNALKNFIDSLRNAYDIILIDCPPINLVVDGLVTSKICDGTLFCTASGEDEPKDLLHAKESLENVGANVLGVVMTKMPENIYRYGYTRYTRYTHSSSGKKKK